MYFNSFVISPLIMNTQSLTHTWSFTMTSGTCHPATVECSVLKKVLLYILHYTEQTTGCVYRIFILPKVFENKIFKKVWTTHPTTLGNPKNVRNEAEWNCSKPCPTFDCQMLAKHGTTYSAFSSGIRRMSEAKQNRVVQEPVGEKSVEP